MRLREPLELYCINNAVITLLKVQTPLQCQNTDCGGVINGM